MGLGFIAGVLRKRHVLRSHERWSRALLDSHQAAALVDLRRWATERSPLYRRFHAGFESRPLAELPVLTKRQLMDSFHDVVTDPHVRLADVRQFLAPVDSYRLFHGRYGVAQTSGSTGSPGMFLWNREEWTTVIASYARAQEWAGINVGLVRRSRIAVVSSRIPWHCVHGADPGRGTACRPPSHLAEGGDVLVGGPDGRSSAAHPCRVRDGTLQCLCGD
jgi:phenylacetate-CoA ligase